MMNNNIKILLVSFVHHIELQNFLNAPRKFNAEIVISFPWAGASNKGGVGRTSYFLALCVGISNTVQDTTKVTAND